MFKSSDAGLTWQFLPAFISPDRRVSRLLINPTDRQVKRLERAVIQNDGRRPQLERSGWWQVVSLRDNGIF